MTVEEIAAPQLQAIAAERVFLRRSATNVSSFDCKELVELCGSLHLDQCKRTDWCPQRLIARSCKWGRRARDAAFPLLLVRSARGCGGLWSSPASFGNGYAFDPATIAGLEDLVLDEHLLVCNTEPGCWVVAALAAGSEGETPLICKQAAVGPNEVVRYSQDYDPDIWRRFAPVQVHKR